MWCRVGICLSFFCFLLACAPRPAPPPGQVAPSAAELQREMQQAQELEHQGKAQDALLIYRRIIRAAPSSPLALNARIQAASLYERRGYLDEAKGLLAETVRMANPRMPIYHKAHLMLARIWLQQGDRKMALSHMNKVNPSMVPAEEYQKMKSLLTPVRQYVVLATGKTQGLEELVSQIKRGMEVALKGLEVQLVEVEYPDEMEGIKGSIIGVVGPLLPKDLPRVFSWAQEKGVPVITPLMVRPGITLGNSPLYRTAMPLDQEVTYTASFLVSKLNVHEMAIFFPDTPYGRVVSDLMEKDFTKEGGKVVLKRSYPPTLRDFTSVVQELKGWKVNHGLPQVLYVPDSWRKVVLLAPQLVFHDLRGITLVGTALWDSPRLVSEGKGYVEYAFFPDTFVSNSPYLPPLEFLYSFRMTYGFDPSPLAAQAYDATKALLIRERMGCSLKDIKFIGVTGMVGFDAHGDPLRVPAFLMVEGGKIEQIN